MPQRSSRGSYGSHSVAKQMICVPQHGRAIPWQIFIGSRGSRGCGGAAAAKWSRSSPASSSWETIEWGEAEARGSAPSASRARAKRLASIEDVGAATAVLATDYVKLITGETFYVDGGYHILG